MSQPSPDFNKSEISSLCGGLEEFDLIDLNATCSSDQQLSPVNTPLSSFKSDTSTQNDTTISNTREDTVDTENYINEEQERIVHDQEQQKAEQKGEFKRTADDNQDLREIVGQGLKGTSDDNDVLRETGQDDNHHEESSDDDDEHKETRHDGRELKETVDGSTKLKETDHDDDNQNEESLCSGGEKQREISEDDCNPKEIDFDDEKQKETGNESSGQEETNDQEVKTRIRFPIVKTPLRGSKKMENTPSLRRSARIAAKKRPPLFSSKNNSQENSSQSQNM